MTIHCVDFFFIVVKCFHQFPSCFVVFIKFFSIELIPIHHNKNSLETKQNPTNLIGNVSKIDKYNVNQRIY